jgi:hypothetical protein
MRKAKSNIINCLLFIIVSLVMICFLNYLIFYGIRNGFVSFPLFHFLDGQSQVISNISIGILGSSIIALAGYIIEYRSEIKNFEKSINNLYWDFYDNKLQGFGNLQVDDYLKLLDANGVFHNLDNLLSECAIIKHLGLPKNNTGTKIKLLIDARAYCQLLLNTLRSQNTSSALVRIEEKYKDAIKSLDSIDKEVDSNIEVLTEGFFRHVVSEQNHRNTMNLLYDEFKSIVGEFDLHHPSGAIWNPNT